MDEETPEFSELPKGQNIMLFGFLGMGAKF